MENNFYVGVVHYGKRLLKGEYTEKLVLYSEDNINYLDLKNDRYYTTDTSSKDYVMRESLISTDISQYRDDYLYLLSKYKENSSIKMKIKFYGAK